MIQSAKNAARIEEVKDMMKCNNCGSALRCSFTMDDPADENKILRRKYCPTCGKVVFTKEEVFRIVKEGVKYEELQEKE